MEWKLMWKNKNNENFKTTIPSNNYRRPKELENLKYFNYLCSILTDDGMCTCEIKSMIAMEKLHLTRRRNFYQQIGIKFEEVTSELLRLEHGSLWC